MQLDNEPFWGPNVWRFVVLFSFCVAAKYAWNVWVGHTYASDPLCIREHYPSCVPMPEFRGVTILKRPSQQPADTSPAAAQ